MLGTISQRQYYVVTISGRQYSKCPLILLNFIMFCFDFIMLELFHEDSIMLRLFHEDCIQMPTDITQFYNVLL
jgi:hypothetical protein